MAEVFADTPFQALRFHTCDCLDEVPWLETKPIYHFCFDKDPSPFVNASYFAAAHFKNECASLHNVGASLIRRSCKKGASEARKIATGAAHKDPKREWHKKKDYSTSNWHNSTISSTNTTSGGGVGLLSAIYGNVPQF